MSEDDDADIAGVPLDEAVDTVAARPDTPGEAHVRRTLERITEDGVVSEDGISSAVADASMSLSNAESRAEMAALTLDDAREAAADVPDVDTVEARLEGFETEVQNIQTAIEDLNDLLQQVLAYDDPDDYYAAAVDIQRLLDGSSDAHGAAAETNSDLEDFERWLTDSTYRYGELGRDIDVLEQSFDTLAESLDDIEAALDDEDEAVEITDDDIAPAWLNATVDLRVKALGIDDARAELADLRAWSGQADLDETDREADLGQRLDDLTDRRVALGDRLDALARPEWGERFDDRLDAIEADLDTFEPPVDFGAVQATIEEHRLD